MSDAAGGDDDPPKRDLGLACPACGCHAHRVHSTRAALWRLVRVRVCKACRHRFRTAERVECRSA